MTAHTLADLQPILALAWEDLLTALLPLAALLFWVISQIAEGKKKQQQQPRQAQRPNPPRADARRQGPRPQQPGARRPQDAAPAPGRQRGGGDPMGDPLRAEVDEFLRRAGRQGQEEEPRAARQRQQAAQARAAAPSIEVLLEDVPLTPATETRRGAMPSEGGASARPLTPTRDELMRQESVAEHVARDIPPSRFETYTSQLGEEVALADDKIEAQLHHKFDHKLGSLGQDVSESEKPPDEPTAAANIAQLLSEPQGMRQAIVLSEILNPPQQRW